MNRGFYQTLASILPDKRLGRYVLEAPLSDDSSHVLARASLADGGGGSFALKIVPHDRSRSAAQDGLLEMAKRAVGIRNDNLATLVEVAVEPNAAVAFLASEFIEGRSLAEEAASAPLDGARAVLAALAALGALEALHAAGALHMDVRPSRLLVETNGRVRLVGTGLPPIFAASSGRGETGRPPIVGSPLYAAPEMAKSVDAVGPHSDVYSLGATLFHLISGRPPFVGNSPVGLLVQHATKPPPRLSSLVAGLDHALARAVDSMLAKSPMDRPSVNEMLPLLRSIGMSSSAVLDRPLSRQWLRKEAILAATLIERGCASRSDLESSLNPKSYSSALGRSIRDLLLDTGAVSRDAIDGCEREVAIREKRRRDADFGRTALDSGFATSQEIDRILSETGDLTSSFADALRKARVLDSASIALVAASSAKHLREVDTALHSRAARASGVPPESVDAARRRLSELPVEDDRSLLELLVDSRAIDRDAAWSVAARAILLSLD